MLTDIQATLVVDKEFVKNLKELHPYEGEIILPVSIFGRYASLHVKIDEFSKLYT